MRISELRTGIWRLSLEQIEATVANDVDALIEVLTIAISPRMEGRFTDRFEPGWTAALVETVADRVLKEIRRPTAADNSEERLVLTQTKCGIAP